jgi:hypothetical protein
VTVPYLDKSGSGFFGEKRSGIESRPRFLRKLCESGSGYFGERRSGNKIQTRVFDAQTKDVK